MYNDFEFYTNLVRSIVDRCWSECVARKRKREKKNHNIGLDGVLKITITLCNKVVYEIRLFWIRIKNETGQGSTTRNSRNVLLFIDIPVNVVYRY